MAGSGTPLFFIIAGEESADNHGAELIKAILAINPSARFKGIGGEKMIEVGLESMEDIQKLAVMGFIEVIRHLGFFRELTKRVLTEIKKCQPTQIILIDYPGFNLRIAIKIKGIFDIPITYYISPQLWAWKEKRVEIIRENVDQMLVIFPFEEDWFRERGVEAEFVGHPIFDEWSPSPKEELCKQLNLDPKEKIVTLYPGSRQQEMDRHLPVFIMAAERLKKADGGIQVVFGAARELNLEKIEIPSWIKVEKNHPKKALECADLVLVSSGSSTIEAAVFGTPMVIIYKMAPFSWYLLKSMVKVPFAGMVNIIAGSGIMPELLQSNATAEKIYEESLSIINDTDRQAEMKNNLKEVKQALKGKGASHRAAELLLQLGISN